MFFFKQKTAYEMRISDWSSDVCSSDLMKKEVEQLLATARREAQEISDRTTKAAEAAAVEIRKEASAEGDRIRERARADAQQLHDQTKIGTAPWRERVCQYV